MAEVVTGEAVVLDVPFARFPSRTLALLIDIAVQLVLLFGLGGVVWPPGPAAAWTPRRSRRSR